ncbi:MAG: hypothetical protein ACOC04_02905 [Halothece sp.]
MNILHALEPDLAMNDPEWITHSPNDLILPQYFYSQLQHLKSGDHGESSHNANQILTSLTQTPTSDCLRFLNQENKQIYFLDQEIAYDCLGSNSEIIDLSIALNRYLVTLYFYAGLLKAQVYFLNLSQEVIYDCLTLKLEVVNTEEFLLSNESWLTPQAIKKIQEQLNPKNKIKWKSYTPQGKQLPKGVKWFNTRG